MASSVQSAAQTESLFYCSHHHHNGASKGLLEQCATNFLSYEDQKIVAALVKRNQRLLLLVDKMLQSRYNNMKILWPLQLSDNSLDLCSHNMSLIKKKQNNNHQGSFKCLKPPPQKNNRFEYI